MALNAGLKPSQIAERVDRLECPMCGTRLRVLVGREWATCECCGVDYAKGTENGRTMTVSRYLPDGHPACPHYLAAKSVLTTWSSASPPGR